MVTKDAVAYHEAGHVAVILCSRLRPLLGSCELLLNDKDQWEGRAHRTRVSTRAEDPQCVVEFALSIAGALAQLHGYRDSVDQSLVAAFDDTGSLLLAIKAVLKSQPSADFNWHNDFKLWLWLCQNPEKRRPNSDGGYLDVESEVRTFIEDSRTVALLHRITKLLIVQGKVSGAELLALPVEDIPKLELPTSFN